MAKVIYLYEYWSKGKSTNRFWKTFLINNAVFGKTMENVTIHKNIKLVTTKRRGNYLVSEPNYHAAKFFTEHLSVIEMKKHRYLWINLYV